MRSCKTLISALLLSIMASMPLYAFDLSLGNDEKSLGIKVTHDADEPFGKPLPWGPASVRFSGSSLWAADTLKNRIVEYDTKGTFLRAIPLKMPNDSTIGDFCFGYFGENKEKALFVCDDDNPVIYVFNSSGEKISQFGSADKKTILMNPHRIEFYDGHIYILDTGLSNILVYNTKFYQGKGIVTYSDNFAIENGNLIHIINTSKKEKRVELYNLKTEERQYYRLDYPEDAEIDLISANENQAFIGNAVFYEGANKAQYQIIQIDKDKNIIKLNTDYPVSFMVKSFIKDKSGKLYQIKFDETKPNKLTIDQLPDNFEESEG